MYTLRCADCECYPKDCKESNSQKYVQIAHERMLLLGLSTLTGVRQSLLLM